MYIVDKCGKGVYNFALSRTLYKRSRHSLVLFFPKMWPREEVPSYESQRSRYVPSKEWKRKPYSVHQGLQSLRSFCDYSKILLRTPECRWDWTISEICAWQVVIKIQRTGSKESKRGTFIIKYYCIKKKATISTSKGHYT